MSRLVIGALVALALVGFGMSYSASSSQETKPQPASAIMRKQRERERSRGVYQGRGEGKSLREIARAGTGDIFGEREIGLDLVPLGNLQSQLNILACDADAVVIGTVESQSARLTEDETWVLTEYKVTVKEVLRDNTTAPIHPGDDITVARSGGTLQINGRKVTMKDRAFMPFRLGDRYLLFLQFVQDKNTYTASNSEGSFLLVNNKALKLKDADELPEELKGAASAESLIANVRAASSDLCSSYLLTQRAAHNLPAPATPPTDQGGRVRRPSITLSIPT